MLYIESDVERARASLSATGSSALRAARIAAVAFMLPRNCSARSRPALGSGARDERRAGGQQLLGPCGPSEATTSSAT